MSDAQDQNVARGAKRKKKRSNIQMAKKFARRRNHGTDIDGDTYQYMIRVLELMKTGFPSFEEKLLFVNNTYEQTIGHELEYARNQVGSRVLDSLLDFANLETIQRLVDAFISSLRPLSSDRFASHVLQKILLVCADRGNRSNSSESTTSPDKVQEEQIEVKHSHVQHYNDMVLRLSRYFINNMEEFVFDTYANHLLRTAIECLAGWIDKVETEGENKRKRATGLAFQGKRRTVNQDYTDLLKQSCNRLRNWPQFLEFGKDDLTSALLQSVLYSTKDLNESECKAYIDKITVECFQPGTEKLLSHIFDAECSVRLLEACLACAEPEQFTDIYEKYFAGHLKQLSLINGVNFSVQRLLDHCPVKECFEKIYEELCEHLPEIRRSGYTGVLASLGNACLRLQTKQGAFVKDITTVLQCVTPESQADIVVAIVGLKPKEHEGGNFPITLHGSLIVQAILNFNKPIKLINSLLEMSSGDLVHLFSDPKGSRITDAFMESKYIGEKSREKLAKKLRGCWGDLAQSTHGSRSLEKMWHWARGNQRLLIMDELSAVGEALRSTKSGRIISSKLNVPLYARSKKDWSEAQGKEEKTKSLFANILGDANKKQ